MRTRARPIARTANRPTSSRPWRGFTLTELVVVLVVLVVLGAMALPSLVGLPDAREAVAAARLRGAVLHARALAMASAAPTWVVFDRAREEVRVLAESRASPGRSGRTPVLDPLTREPLVLRLAELGTGIGALSLGAGEELGFDSLGVPRSASGSPLATDGTIVLAGGTTVQVARGTGRVGIEGGS